MESIYLVKGLDCANCAREFEEKVSKLENVEEATMNFMSLKLIVKSNSDCTNQIIDLANNFEDGLILKKIR